MARNEPFMQKHTLETLLHDGKGPQNKTEAAWWRSLWEKRALNF